MSKKLLLVTHPPLSLVIEQLVMPTGFTERYGEYVGQKPRKTIRDTRLYSIDELYEIVHIAPEQLQRIPGGVGRVAILGFTPEGESAKVDLNPFKALDNLGAIIIGE